MWPTVPHFTDPPPVSQPAYVLFFSPDFFPAFFLMCFSISHFMVLQLVGKRVEMGSRRILQRCTCFDFNFPPCEKCIANIAIFFPPAFRWLSSPSIAGFSISLSNCSSSYYSFSLSPALAALHICIQHFLKTGCTLSPSLIFNGASISVCVCVMNMRRCTGKDIGYERNPISPV